jgi:hypothetical protein
MRHVMSASQGSAESVAGTTASPSAEAAGRRRPSPAAERALAEAAARRAAASPAKPRSPPEHGGRGGLEPVRYGDWEVRGLASDF